MFDIDDLLSTMDIVHTCKGSKEFQCLALVSMSPKLKAVTFIDSQKYISAIPEDDVIVLTTNEIAAQISGRSLCICASPRQTFFELHNYLVTNNDSYKRILFNTEIGNGCKIHKLSSISENNVRIGNNVTIEEFVSIKENVIIGDNTIIRAGTIIGGEGFEHKRMSDETILSVKHAGGVIIGNNVEIQQNTVVDRAVYPWDDTVIGDYCKIDNLIHIAHAVKMDKCTMVAALSCIAGRTHLGQNVWVGPGVTIINGIDVGDNARTNIGSVVTRGVPANGSVTGNFAIEHSRFIKNLKASTQD